MDWKITRVSNSQPSRLEADGTSLVSVTNAGGFRNWDVRFPNGKKCRQRTLDDAKAYAEAHAAANAI